MDPLSRRRLLQAGLAALCLPSLLARRSAVGAAVPAIHSRADWGADLPPRGPLEPERPEDVRFLLVHHSASVNDYPSGAVPEELRSFFRLHTAPEKGWADIAYNFLVDRFGGIWEGRAGSLEAPVKGDATGGSQGFALLCCFIGDHRTEAPSPEAQASMVALLAWLAERYGIDPRPWATTSFISRGSNLWPAGTAVTTTTIAGHRDMSRTACPGDAAYHLVRHDLPARVASATGAGATSAPPTAPAPPVATSTGSPPVPARATPTSPSSAPTTTSTTTPPPPATFLAVPASPSPTEAATRPQRAPANPWPFPLGVTAGAVALALALRNRRGRSPK